MDYEEKAATELQQSRNSRPPGTDQSHFLYNTLDDQLAVPVRAKRKVTEAVQALTRYLPDSWEPGSDQYSP